MALENLLFNHSAMFQRDYLNVPKLHEGKLRIDHVEKIVRNALARWRLAGDDRVEDHTDPNKGIFVVSMSMLCPIFFAVNTQARLRI